jgi:hypothetical protein
MAEDVGEQAAWSSVVEGLIYNPTTAICAYWRDAKADGTYLGVPVSPELDAGEGAVEMAFSSGAVLRWEPGVGVTVL